MAPKVKSEEDKKTGMSWSSDLHYKGFVENVRDELIGRGEEKVSVATAIDWMVLHYFLYKQPSVLYNVAIGHTNIPGKDCTAYAGYLYLFNRFKFKTIKPDEDPEIFRKLDEVLCASCSNAIETTVEDQLLNNVLDLKKLD